MKRAAIVLCLFVLASCARNLNSDIYTESDEVGLVTQGIIISSRLVTVKGSDKLGNNAIGGLAGGVGGGIAGSTIGGGSGKTAATAGGAIAGAVVGAMIEDELSTTQGIEYIVKLTNLSKSESNKFNSREEVVVNKDTVKDKLRGTINTPDSESDIISTVQGTDVQFQPGQKVYVIYNTNRVRLVAAY
ncbi:MAG: hypothetical protein COV36_00705 [Alphaproteobacteria bacterium CG11_big_fil_rev_8_21_14_0_20_44_7]|nr:MAG: hypothetical protein COV36_00705 [Alphaproteobacteria bacterium CG11_big_fil_rev_8_21_14_0_20_44_7]